MEWPTIIVAHKSEPHFPGMKDDVWQERDGDGLRYCSYCGSLHPEDFFKLLNTSTDAMFADMKYGYPHKIYINNYKKFYTIHLYDIKDENALNAVVERIKDKLKVELKLR